MLKDSIHWRTEKIKKCLENGTKTCGKNKCNSKCKCYERWVKQKREEWRKIVQHFKTQKGLPGGLSHYKLLELLLEKGVLLTSIKEAYGNAKELEGIKNMLKEEERKNKEEEAADGTDNENNTTIDKLLNHEAQDADKCLQKCQDPQQPPQQERGVARSATSADSPPPPRPADEEEEDEDEEDEDGEQDNQETTVNEEEEKEEKKEDATVEGGSPPASQEDGVNPYNSRLGWKCIPSGKPGDTTGKSDASGSICVPPRRRRLYVGKLHDWASGNTQVGGDSSQGDAASKDPKVELRTAFIQTAAIETFFLWHEYKQENKTQNTSQLLPQQPVTDSDGDPQNKLKSGKIPPDFLRQMFYTLGDYRDILEGKNDILIGKTGSGASDKEMADRESKIKDSIQKLFQNGEKNPHGAKDPKEWWEKNGQHIWNGMVCALTYKDSGTKDTPPTQIEGAQNLLKKIKEETGEYHYKNVKLKDEPSETQAKPTHASPSSGDNNPPKLTEFVERPPYFRYLEEWGETFCRERAKRLAQIKKDCKVDEDGRKNGNKKCSGYGEDCEDQLGDDPSTFKDLWCQDCGKSCRSYRKWIGRKRKEFDKQSNAYIKQKDKCKKESKSAEERLKSGPCKKNSGEGNIDFGDKTKTFGPATNCTPCPKFKVNCKNANCNGDKKIGCKSKTHIDVNDFQTRGNFTDPVDMVVSDKSGNEFQNDLNECKDAGIFEGIRKEEWKCRNECGYVVCKQEKGNGKPNGENPIITITALVTHWVQNFLEDYNKIRKKLKPCMYDGKESSCKNK
ncbi:hypothetical protein PFHG_05445, partial [Plasmodium falciparum HB3]